MLSFKSHDKIYGWYSLNAYNNGEPEYIYMNNIGQKTLCTIISYDKKCPYPNHTKYKDVVFMGELNYQC